MPEEPDPHRLRQVGRHLVHTEPHSGVEAGHQVGVLDVEPGHRLRRISRRGSRAVRRGQRLLVRDGQRQVVPQDPAHGRVGLWLLVGGEVRRVLPDQVVHPVPPGRRLLDQVGVDQLVQCRADPAGRQVGERPHRRRVEVGPRQDAQQPEHAALDRVELPQRHPEHRVEAVGGVAQPLGQHRHGPARPVAKSRAGHPQRQRKPAALRQHLADRILFGQREPGRPAEQMRRVVVGQRLQRHRRHPVQADQPVAAGDQDRGLPGPGQQRAHLFRVDRVVEHDEHPPTGQLRPPQRRAFGDAGRRMRHLQGGQQPAQRGLRIQRLLARGEAVQVEVEPAVRIRRGEPVGHVHGQAGLSDARHAVDSDRGSRAQQLLDQRGLSFPAGEVEQVGRQVVAARSGRRAGPGRLGPHRAQGPGIAAHGPAKRHHGLPRRHELTGQVPRQRRAAQPRLAGEGTQAERAQLLDPGELSHQSLLGAGHAQHRTVPAHDAGSATCLCCSTGFCVSHGVPRTARSPAHP
ncbi:hypothetical protein GA0070609_1587 [Micromonospora echinaurantiaca]|uniref:Uncharacterized protein n=1 Tax=Micromonospora echinaurantiaca TaxID=47857 RepID=A0A1C5HGL6_9ACTN|nr:hypothetical protein GA0070609_1587 [Micromonospora echinaurantiaca]